MFLDFGLSNGIGVSEVAHGFGVVAVDLVAGVGVIAVALMFAESGIILLDVFIVKKTKLIYNEADYIIRTKATACFIYRSTECLL